MKTLMNNINKLTGTDKAYYIVSLIAAPLVILFCILAVLNMIF